MKIVANAAAGFLGLMLSPVLLVAVGQGVAAEEVQGNGPTKEMMFDTLTGLAASYEYCKLAFPSEAAEYEAAWAVRVASVAKSTLPAMQAALAMQSTPEYIARVTHQVEAFNKQGSPSFLLKKEEACPILKDVEAFR